MLAAEEALFTVNDSFVVFFFCNPADGCDIASQCGGISDRLHELVVRRGVVYQCSKKKAREECLLLWILRVNTIVHVNWLASSRISHLGERVFAK